MERRLSTTSDSSTDSKNKKWQGSGSYLSRYSCGEPGDGVQSRVPKSMSPKVAVNPLQFVKVGPCDLYRSAQEQLKKVEEIKKAKKECRDEAEDWQSNLDNWKCSRRKRQEHIIERVVEVKKFELEEHERNRRKSKTFNEMLQERNTRGRKASLPIYHLDESNDLSDLGLSNGKSSSSSSTASEKPQTPPNEYDTHLMNTGESSHTNGTPPDENSPTNQKPKDGEEYTYEWAIQSYVNFTESRVKSKSTTSINKDNAKNKFIKDYPPVPAKPSGKVDEYLKRIEQNNKNESITKESAVPKVNVNRRRELFEKINGTEDINKSKGYADVSNIKTIKERMTSLEKPSDTNPYKENKINSIPTETLVKNRLIDIQTITNSNTSTLSSRKAIDPVISIKDRLSSLSKGDVNTNKISKTIIDQTVTLKERMDSLQSSINKEIPKHLTNGIKTSFENDILTDDQHCDKDDLNRPFSPDDMNSKRHHFRHRSLDSLDIDQENNVGGGSFERVQSLEDLEYCRNYPPSTFSGDTDREDSGIHTADVSSSVSQADDYDLHLDGNILEDIKTNHQPPIAEESKHLSTDLLKCSYEDEASINNVSCKPCDFLETSSKVEQVVENSSISKDNLPANISNSSYCLSSNLESSPESNSAIASKMDTSLNNSLTSSTQLVDQTVQDSVNTSDSTLIQGELDDSIAISHSQDQHELPLDNSSYIPQEEFKEIESDVHLNDTSNVEMIGNNKDANDSNFIPISKYPQGVNADNSKEMSYDNKLVCTKKQTMDVGSLIAPIENNQYKGIIMDVYSETQHECLFNLNPVALEPPKEKPPPPPTDLSDGEEETNNHTKMPLRRLDSTKRIKKEIRQKRSSFLGIEGNDDENYLDPELELVRPPDMTALLAEERRMERQLYRQSICSESDSNQESRDSGVELDNKIPDTWSHSRNDSEIYGNQSTTSEEDEIMKKEREIIETLEQEEKIRKQDLGEKLAMRLRELEAEKNRYEWHPESPIEYNNKPHHYKEDVNVAANAKEKLSRENMINQDHLYHVDSKHQKREWSEPRNPYQGPDNYQGRRLDAAYHDNKYNVNYRKSLQDLTHVVPGHHIVPISYENVAHRRSMPNLQEVAQRRQPPPPPVHQEKHNFTTNPSTQPSSQQMTRQTLQALSAAPRSRLISNDTWQAKRKQQRPENYNYQHWLIQEAEHRRITEQQQRQAGNNYRNSSIHHSCQNTQKWPNGHYYPEAKHTQVQNIYNGHSNPARPVNQSKTNKPLPDSIIQTLTQRVQRMNADNNNRRRNEVLHTEPQYPAQKNDSAKDKMLSVSGKKRCSHCGEELGRGAAMIIESLQLFYHIDCFKCCVCCLQLGDGLMGTDVRVRNNKLHCHNCYSSDDGKCAKFSCV